MIEVGKVIISLIIYDGNVSIKTNSKSQLQYISFVCRATHLTSSLKKLGQTSGLQKEIINQDSNLNESIEGNYSEKRDEWLAYLKMDELSLAFLYARSSMNMDQTSIFRKKG